MTLDNLTGGVALRSLCAASLFPLFGAAAQAQQVPGTPGSPEATETISGKQLLPPPQEVKGKIERTGCNIMTQLLTGRNSNVIGQCLRGYWKPLF
jgi:hypothetical protein